MGRNKSANRRQERQKKRKAKAAVKGAVQPQLGRDEWNANLRSLRPELFDEINEEISQVIQIAGSRNPLDLLAAVTTRNCLRRIDGEGNDLNDGNEAFAEYALSIILGIDALNWDIDPTDEEKEAFSDLIESIHRKVLLFYTLESSEGKKSLVEYEIRFKMISKSLMVRGDSIFEHGLELAEAVLGPHNAVIEANFGVTINEIIGGITEIVRQVNENLESVPAFAALIFELREDFFAFLENQEGEEDAASIEDIKRQFNELPEVKLKRNRLEAAVAGDSRSPFLDLYRVRQNERLSSRVLNLFKAVPAQNRNFVDFSGSPAWPLNETNIGGRSLIEHNGEWYAFLPLLLERNLIDTIERRINECDPEYFATYLKKRGKVLEDKAVDYLSIALPGAFVYRNAYYWPQGKGRGERYECDCLIVFDTHLFIVESKAGTMSASAKRGSTVSIRQDLKLLLDSAYGQALRVRDYIYRVPEARFETERGDELVTLIGGKSPFRDVYLLNITLENLSVLSSRLNSLRSLKLLKGEDWPWSVFINDLRIIAELCGSPTEFLVYIQRRLRANDYPQFAAQDELDYFIHFLKSGLYFEGGRLDRYSYYGVPYSTDEIDLYYHAVYSRIGERVRPSLEIPDEYKQLIAKIEATKKQGFSFVTMNLLGLGLEAINFNLKYLKKIVEMSNRDRNPHEFTTFIRESRTGLTITTRPSFDPVRESKMEAYAQLKMYQTKAKHWIIVFLDLSHGSVSGYDFSIFGGQWQYDSVLASLVRELPSHKYPGKAHFPKPAR